MPSQPIHFSGGQSMSQHTAAEKFVRRSSFLLIALFAIAVFSFKAIHHTAQAQTAGGTRLLRTPTVSATQIAFAYAQNVWTVPRAGGMARRITSFQGQTSNPHFSPDGKWIAFSGEYAGNLDVYVVAGDGGEPKRLTWHPGADTVQGWTPGVRRRGLSRETSMLFGPATRSSSFPMATASKRFGTRTRKRKSWQR